MKIFLISNLYPSKKHPYYGVFVQNIVYGLEMLGLEFPCMSVIKGKKKGLLDKLWSYLLFYIGIIYNGLNVKYQILYVHYYTHCAIPVLILKILKKRIPLVINAHGGDVTEDNKMSALLQPVSRLLLKRTDKFIVPSRYFKELMIKKYQLNSQSFFISPSGGIDIDLFKPLNKKTMKIKYGFNPNDIVLGFVGRLTESKGWDVYLSALNYCRDKGLPVKGMVVGDGENRRRFIKMVGKMNLEQDIIFFKMMHQEELAIIYNTMNYFIFPTRTISESLGLVGLEAMACGVPVIGSRFAGLVEYVKEGINGYLFKVDCIDELAKKIISASKFSKVQQDKMAIEARKTAEAYSSKKTSKQLKEMLDSIILDRI